MINEFDKTRVLGIATLTQSQCEFIRNEPADLLKKNAIYLLQPQLSIPKEMHIHDSIIISYRFTAIEIVDGEYQRCVKIKVASFTRKGVFNGVSFNNQVIIPAQGLDKNGYPYRIDSPITIVYLGQGKYFDGWSQSERYCETFQIHEDTEGYSRKFSLVDLCPQIKDYLL